jgi:flagellar hook-associated protein 3 FlgL
MIYQSRLTEIGQYISNIDESKSRLSETDATLQSAVRILQRVRVLTVQGANGIYTSFERKEAAATEINQMLEEMLAIANTRGATGRAIFGGHQTGSQDVPDPFLPIYQTLAGGSGDVMTGVEYRGNTGGITRELANGVYMDVNIPGNHAFWATNQVLSSTIDASNYISETNQVIKIDGKEINISAGDNIDVIIQKINNTALDVRASKGGRNNLVLESTVPHQIWLEDQGSGRVFKDIGMVNTEFPDPPNNLAPTVIVDGMSVFEMMIRLRDDFIRNDQELIGGRDLGLIDLALENFLKHIAQTGAKQNRVEEAEKRSEYAKANVLEMLSKTEGIDIAEEIMNFKWLESVHQYALAVGARTIRPTLMDFLR